MTATLIDQVETITGKLSIRRLDRLNDISDKRLVEWRADFRNLCGAVDLVPAKPISTEPNGHLRPYVLQYPYLRYPYSLDTPYSSDIIDRYASAIDYYCTAADDVYSGRPRADDQHRAFIRHLAKRLLYCHSVAIDDPLTTLVDGWGGPVEIRSALAFLSRIRPLVKAGLIVLLPGDVQGWRKWWYRRSDSANRRQFAPRWYEETIGYSRPDSLGSSADLNAPVSTYAPHVITEELRRRIAATYYESDRGPIANAAAEVSEGVYRLLNFNGAIDFDMPDGELYRIALAEVLAQEAASAGLGHTYQSLNEMRVRTLVRLSVPTFEELPVSDLIRLHSDTDVFTRWRIDLGRALDIVTSETDPESGQLDDRTRQRFWETIWPALDDIRSSSLPNKSIALKGVQSLALGSVPVAMGLISKSAIAGVATAGISSSLACVWTYTASRSKRKLSSVAKRLKPID